MPRHTQKTDWLNQFLASQPDTFVSSDPGFARWLGFSEREMVEIRFVGSRRRIFAYVLTINAPFERWQAVKSTAMHSRSAKMLLETLRGMLGSPVFFLIYSDEIPHQFSATSTLARFRDITTEELQMAFRRISPLIVNRSGADKRINKSVNDSFQRWTRRHLSSFISVNDLDAIRIDAEPVIFELKRIREDPRNWCPYVDDEPNYAALLRIRETRRIAVRTAAYQPGNERYVAVHHLDATTRKVRRRCQGSITGRSLVGPPGLLLKPFPANRPDVKCYRSLRWRERPCRTSDRRTG